ncbi:JDVT-CTERM system glutamic-type intramembrane protease MrtJ [Vibrio superstes]|uniref:JDVT-CTERM system glutamic-type intramembrane protease MrtJ n=1 Tax=Vibrio superstes TaxID=198815 RepID=UPI000E5B3C7C|nr:JDVT-CTERM system glutamic-type intramembrane protease [Vibrio superstes]
MHYLKPSRFGVLDELALRGDRRWVSDRQFTAAWLFGIAVGLLLFSDHVPDLNAEQFLQTLLVAVLVSPVIEELLFRGILQGRLLRLDWGRKHLIGFTRANLCCSLLFTAFHLSSHAPIWSIGVFFPSLLFGYFRDKHNSVYPSIVLHIFYNAVYFLLPILISYSF